MGSMRAAEMAQAVMDGYLTLETALIDHFTANMFPPAPPATVDQLVQVAHDALLAVAQDDPTREIAPTVPIDGKMPLPGIAIGAEVFVEMFNLEAFVPVARQTLPRIRVNAQGLPDTQDARLYALLLVVVFTADDRLLLARDVEASMRDLLPINDLLLDFYYPATPEGFAQVFALVSTRPARAATLACVLTTDALACAEAITERAEADDRVTQLRIMGDRANLTREQWDANKPITRA